MVLQNTQSSFHAPRFELDGKRIVALSGALAINVAALLLLLVPATMPPAQREAPPRPIWILPVDRIPPSVPPIPVPVVKPQTPSVEPRAVTPPQVAAPTVDPVVVPDGTLQADPVVAAPTDSTPVDVAPATGPVQGVRLEYLTAPAPTYPRDALLSHLQGTVLLQVLVGEDGRPLEVDIRTSSGHRSLDEAARRFVLKRWTFRPAMRDGRAVQAIGLVPIDFSLDR